PGDLVRLETHFAWKSLPSLISGRNQIFITCRGVAIYSSKFSTRASSLAEAWRPVVFRAGIACSMEIAAPEARAARERPPLQGKYSLFQAPQAASLSKSAHHRPAISIIQASFDTGLKLLPEAERPHSQRVDGDS